jgi:hypothetical protein
MGINGIVKRNRFTSLVIGSLVGLVALWATINTAQAQSTTKKDFMGRNWGQALTQDNRGKRGRR